MKKVILIFALSFLAFSMNAQTVSTDTTRKEYKNMIGIDAMSLLLQFVDRGENALHWYSPYLINYKRIWGKNAFRAGIGLSSYQSNRNDDENEIENEYKYRYSRFYTRLGLGYERQVNLGKRWMMYFGADVFGGYDYNYTRNEYASPYRVNRYETKGVFYGISPVLGFSFNINKRLSLATETCYDVMYETIKDEHEYSGYGSDNHTTSKGSSFNMNFNAPTAINFRVKL